LENIILNYLTHEQNIPQAEAKSSIAGITLHEDILNEVIYWIKNRDYEKRKPITISGYSARMISKMMPSLNVVGVYNIMIQLREDPNILLSQFDRDYKDKEYLDELVRTTNPPIGKLNVYFLSFLVLMAVVSVLVMGLFTPYGMISMSIVSVITAIFVYSVIRDGIE